ncbi:MAG: hypothetical protein ACT4QC_04985 [Planctomycetaceae bacterium]
MKHKPEAIIDAFWDAAESLPNDAVAATHLLELLAGLCERLDRIEPAERFREAIRECRESAEQHRRLLSGNQVRLAYSYSTLGNGFVELSTFNAELTEVQESGTVVGKPGARIVFDEHEARRAIHILATLFPEACAGKSPDH